MAQVWDPQLYDRYRDERSRPFFDLLDRIEPATRPRVLDLGCGTGELTQALHRKLDARETVGVDNSEAMLERSPALAGDGLSFECADLAIYRSEAPFDVVFSNAALQWVGQHEALLGHLTELVAPGGQLAFQVPFNHDEVQHRTAIALGDEEPYRSARSADPVNPATLQPQDYARLLHRLGYREQDVLVRVYPHLLDSREAVIDWIRGTALNAYKKILPAELFERYLDEYRARLLPALPDDRPFFFPFRRIFVWGRRQQPMTDTRPDWPTAPRRPKH